MVFRSIESSAVGPTLHLYPFTPSVLFQACSGTLGCCRYIFARVETMEDGTKMSERALEPCRHPPRIRRLCSNRRDGGRRMAQVCLLPVFATRRHGQETSLTTTTGGRGVRPSASRLRPSRPRQSMPPAARPPCACAPKKHTPEDRDCRLVGGRAARHRVMVSLPCPTSYIASAG